MFLIQPFYIQYVRWGRLPPSYKINGSLNQKNNGTLWSKKSDSKSDSQNLSSKSLSMWRQWFFEILKSLRASKKDAFKKNFKCNFKNLRGKLLTKHDFSQYPEDPSFSFLCQKKFFEQLDFFSKFFGNFIVVRKKWNLEFWKFQGTIKCPRLGILKWFSRNFARTQSLIFKSKSCKFRKKNFKKFLSTNRLSDQKTNGTLWSKKTDSRWVSRNLSSKFWRLVFLREG